MPTFTDRDLARLVVGGAVVVGLLALFAPWWPVHDLSATFTPELVEMLQMIDSTAQRSAHQLALVFLALGALACLYLRAYRPRLLQGSTAAAIARGVHLVSQRGPMLFALIAAITLWLAPERRALAYGLLLVPVALIVRYVRPALLDKAGWAALLIYFPLLMLPGLFLAPLLQADAIWFEWHYGAMVGLGERLAAGTRLYGEVPHNYALLLSMASGIFERHVTALSAGHYYRAIQGLNLVFALLAGIAYWRWRPGNALKVLVPMLLVLPWIHSEHLCLNFPNHSAWRFIGFPLAVLLLLTLRQTRTDRLPLLLGGIAAIALLFNLETGIALSFGLLIFLIARVGPAPFATWPGRAVGFAFGLAAVVAITVLIYRAGLGTWPFPHSLGEFLGSFSSYSGGYSGYPLSSDPLALLIFLHASYVAAYGALRWRFGALHFATAFRMTIATTLLVWFVYYVNRPISWYLWSYLFLYGFLFADFVDARLLRWNWARVRSLRISAATIVLALVIIPTGVQLNREALAQSYLATTKVVKNPTAVKTAIKTVFKCPPQSNQGCLSLALGLEPTLSGGIPLPSDLEALIQEKADYLAAQPDKHELAYFTVDSYFVPRLTGLYERRLGYRDAFSQTVTNRQMDELVARVLALAPPRILFDAPDSIVFSKFETKYQGRFYERLRTRLQSAYQPTKTEHGWLILTPKAP